MTSTLTAIPESAKRPLPAADAQKLRAVLAGTALVAAAGGVAAAVLDAEQFYFRYLTTVLFLVSLGAGSLFWLLLHYLTGASWSLVMRRLIEHATTILVPAALLFLPLLWGLGDLFAWAGNDVDPVVAAKQGYLIGLSLCCGRSVTSAFGSGWPSCSVGALSGRIPARAAMGLGHCGN